MHTRLFAAVAVLVLVLVFLPVQAFGQNYDPVPGGELLDRLRSSLFLGTTENTASTQSVGGDAVNPAASALKQRIHIDTSYIGIVGSGALDGHAANLGLSVPTRVGVFSGSGNFVTADYDAMNLGTRGSVNVSFAKDLYPSLLVGTGIRTHFGSDGGNSGFGAGLDVGMVHIIGPVGFMPDLRWGVALSQLGVGYKPKSGTTGSPAPFTPAADIQAVLVDTDAVNLVVHTGFSAPSFQNLRYRAGSQLSFFDKFALNLGWDIDLREQTEAGREAGSLLPSVGLTFRVATGGSGGNGDSGGDQRWNRSDIDVHTAWAPLYDEVWAAGAGAQIALGVVDRNPPEIAVEYAQRAYISPNNDGKSDDLLLPVTITDERYVLQWAVDIHELKNHEPASNGAEGALIRRIENKEERPENEGFRNVIDRLLYVRKGVSVPEFIRWDGRTDSGGVAPDGTYVFFVTAVDDNDNVGSAGPFEVVLDNTAPELTFIEAAGEDGLIFSPNDDGIKDVLIVETESSPEDSWTVEVLDGADVVVYSTAVEGGTVGTISWNGLDADGVLVPDGVYSIRVSSTDRAENTTVERLNNIIVDTEPTPIGLAIDVSHFSPNDDGRRDTVTFTPDVSVTEGIREYEIVVRDRDGRARRTRRGDTLPLNWVFDGRDEGGKLLPEGTYRGELNLRYRHGNQPTAVSPDIVLDITPPRLSVRADTPVFSPNGDGLVDTVRFMQSTDSAPTWSAVIEPVSPTGAGEIRPIRRYQWSGLPAEQVEWDGRDDQGNRVPDGRYQYVLTGEDQAANRASSHPTVVELDTRDTPVYIFPSTSDGDAAPSGRDAPSAPDRRQRTGEAFSPNGDGVQDTMYLVTDIADPRGAQRFQIEILNADDNVVARVDGSDAPRRSYPWDGRDSSGSIAPDGTYRARLTVEYRHGNRPVATSPPFVLDTVPPRATVAVAEAERVFSPDGDGDKDTIRISQSSSREPLWNGRILRRSDNRPVRTWQFSGTLQELTWDGTNDDGEIVSDGEYYYEVIGRDDGGNRTVARTEPFRTDTRDIEIRLRASRYAFSPNNDGVHDDVTFLPEVNIDLTVTEWTVAVFPADGDPARPIFSRSGTGALEPVVWDGMSDAGRPVPDGEYRAVVTAQPVQRVEPVSVYSARTVQLDTRPPAVTVNLSTPIISPNGDGNLDELVITQETSEEERWVGTVTDDGGREVSRWEWVGRAPEELRFAGLDTGNNRLSDGFYTYRITGTDGAGNTGTSDDHRFEIYTAETPLQFYAQQRAFSPNGDGIKDSLPLTAVIALPEDVETWTFMVMPEGLEPVYRKTGTAADIPRSFTWNGRTDGGNRAAEGPYRAELTVTYRHGNVAVAGTDSFVLDVTPPRISVTTDFTVFSPGGDSPGGASPGGAGRRNSLRFDQTSDVAEGWTGRITNAAAKVVRSYSWNRTAEPFEWNGADRAGNTLPDGEYTYTVTGTDEAGNTGTFWSGPITIDTRPTRIYVTLGSRRFSPNGDGILDNLEIGLITNRTDGAEERIVEIVNASGAVVRTFRADRVQGRETVLWDGKDDRGRVTDGQFTVRYRVIYNNGAVPQVDSPSVTLDTSGPELTANLRGLPFSPDNDGLNDELTIHLAARDASPISSWSFDILDRGNRPFYRFQGTGDPRPELIWDGRSTDGETVISAEDYPYRFTAVDAVGNRSEVRGLIPIDILVIRDGDLLKIQISNINFEPNSPVLQLDAATEEGAKNIAVLDRLVQVFDKYQTYRIRVEGHAVNVTQTEREEREELQPLSLARAQTVRTALIERGMDPGRISTVGRGGTAPIVPHTDLNNRWKNRRVEFILIR